MSAGIAVTLGCQLGFWSSFEGAVLTPSRGGWSVVNGELNNLSACVAFLVPWSIPPMVMNQRCSQVIFWKVKSQAFELESKSNLKSFATSPG